MKSDHNPNSSQQWFTEASLPFSQEDVRVSVRYDELLLDDKSEFRHLQVFDTPFHGRMLTLDGIIQVAENDEFIYHEMMIILPAIKHGNPKNVLIIGGGDGGAVKQALRIKSVEKVVLVEIDRTVIDVCEQYIPSIANNSLLDPRVEVIITDGMKYVEQTKDTFDIIALDLTDPLPNGPAVGLYEEPFYKNVRKCLSKDGVVSTHCSSLVVQPEEARTMVPRLENVFDEVVVHTAVIPTYQLTSFGFLIARPNKVVISEEQITHGFNNIKGESLYLSREMYSTSSVLPPYIRHRIGI